MPTDPIPWNGFVLGAAPGQEPYATIYDSDGQVVARVPTMSFDPTGASGVVPFLGGVRAVLGNLTHDVTPDLVVGAMAGGGPRVQVFDGKTYQLLYDFYAFDPNFAGGVNLAVGMVTAGDALGDIVVGAGPGGGPHVKVFDGRNGAEVVSLYAYDEGFRGGVSVAALQSFSAGQVITGAGPGGGPHVKVYGWELEYVPPTSGEIEVVRTGRLAELSSYYAFDPDFRGGVNVTAGDELPRMEVFSYSGPVVVPPAHIPPVLVALPPDSPPPPPPPPPPPVGTRFFADSGAPVVVAQASGGSQVRYFAPDGASWTLSPFGDFGGGASVIVRHVAGDLSRDLIVGAGPGGGARVRVIGGGVRPLLDFYAEASEFLGGVQVG